jgi:hypothetical protein
VSRRPRDRDVAEQIIRWRTFQAAAAGCLIGGMAGRFRLGSAWGFAVGAAIGGVVVLLLSGSIVNGAARLMQRIYLPSGASTPSRHGFSDVDAHILRERFGDAAALLEHHAIDHPDDPEAYLRLARLHRDQLGDPSRALQWFGHAQATRRLTPGQARVVRDEIDALRARRGHPSPSIGA